MSDDSSQLYPWKNLKQVYDWKDSLEDFSDTAHIINQLDLVISVDTAVAHLSGALNKPTWLMLPQEIGGRWLRERSILLGISSMRLSPGSPWWQWLLIKST